MPRNSSTWYPTAPSTGAHAKRRVSAAAGAAAVFFGGVVAALGFAVVVFGFGFTEAWVFGLAAAVVLGLVEAFAPDVFFGAAGLVTAGLLAAGLGFGRAGFFVAGFFVDEAAFVLPADFFATGGAPTAAVAPFPEVPSDDPAVRRVMPRTAADATATAIRNARMPRALPRFRLPALARARRCVAGRATGCGIVEKPWRGLRGRHRDVGKPIQGERAGASTSGNGTARAGSASITRRATGPGLRGWDRQDIHDGLDDDRRRRAARNGSDLLARWLDDRSGNRST